MSTSDCSRGRERNYLKFGEQVSAEKRFNQLHYEVKQISEISNDFGELERQGTDKANKEIRIKKT